MKYRLEIDGLRAVAVLPVIFFHAGFEWFSGGFVGVDIFFVISGYLITSIIILDMQNEQFSLVGFYERRARRILPALFFVMFFCLPFAWLWMLPNQMKELSQSLVAVSLFVSNILFWSETGYFAPSSEEMPLLHTWSLSVEEQFYLLFPLLLLLTWRMGRNAVFCTIIVVAIVSFVLSEWGWRYHAAANFYFAPTRAWELLAGSIAAFWVTKNGIHASNLLSSIGAIFIAISIFLFNESLPFPSVFTLVPVVGTVLLLLFATSDTFVAKILSSKLFVGVGLVSYSAYLWHQPLFAFARIKSVENTPSSIIMLLLSCITLVFAVVTWKYIESPFRRAKVVNRSSIFSLSLFGLTFFIVFGLVGANSNGFESLRYSKDELHILNQFENRSARFTILGDELSKPSWMLLGDSHANTLQEALGALLKVRSESSLVRTIDGCPPALNLWRLDVKSKGSCHANYENALAELKEGQIKNVLISARYPLYLSSERFNNQEGGVEEGATSRVVFDHVKYIEDARPSVLRQQAVELEMYNYIKTLSDIGINVFLIPAIPEVGWNVPEEVFRRIGGNGELKTSRSVFNARIEPLADLFERLSSLPNVHLVQLDGVFCDELNCYATDQGTPLYFDSNHPNRIGAIKIIRHFASFLD